MILADPEGRRGLRSIIQGLIAIACLAGLWWLISLLRTDRDGLILIAKGALVLLGIGTVGYQFENGMRAFKLSVSKDGATVEANGDEIHSGDTVTVSKEPDA